MLKTDLPQLTAYRTTLAEAGKKLFLSWVLYSLGIVVAVILSYYLIPVPASGIMVALLLLLALFIPAIRNRLRPLWVQGVAKRVFAQQNSMLYLESSKPNYKKHFQPAVAKLGFFERNEQIVKGELGGLPFEMYAHTFRQLFARRYGRKVIQVYSVKLPKELPHIFMRNRQAGSKHLSSLPRHFDDDQRVSLEGNFDTFFTVYTHRRTITEALSLLSPNVMEALVRSNTKFDIEIIGTRLYLYSDNYLTTAHELDEALRSLINVAETFEHRLKSWRFVLPNNQHYPYLVSRPGFGTVALGHTYFNQAWLLIIWYTLYSALKITAKPELWPVKVGLVIFFDALMITVLLVLRRRYQLSKRNVGR